MARRLGEYVVGMNQQSFALILRLRMLKFIGDKLQ